MEDGAGERVPLFMTAVAAGSPGRADDHVERWVNLNEYLIKNPGWTFLVPVLGDSMQEDGISDGDILLVDRKVEARAGDIVVVDVDGELTVKRLNRVGKRLWLVPSNRNLSPVEVKGEQVCNVWGVVIYTIKKNRRSS